MVKSTLNNSKFLRSLSHYKQLQYNYCSQLKLTILDKIEGQLMVRCWCWWLHLQVAFVLYNISFGFHLDQKLGGKQNDADSNTRHNDTTTVAERRSVSDATRGGGYSDPTWMAIANFHYNLDVGVKWWGLCKAMTLEAVRCDYSGVISTRLDFWIEICNYIFPFKYILTIKYIWKLFLMHSDAQISLEKMSPNILETCVQLSKVQIYLDVRIY